MTSALQTAPTPAPVSPVQLAHAAVPKPTAKTLTSQGLQTMTQTLAQSTLQTVVNTLDKAAEKTGEAATATTDSAQTATQASAQTIVETKNLSLWYNDFQALYDVNMQIKEHEITALIGPSGCGKSTYLKTLNRMNDLVGGCKIAGSVLIGGHNIYADNIDVTELRTRVGMVFQKPNPFPMSVYDNIAYGPRLHGTKKRSELDEIVETALRQAAIWDEVKNDLKKSALGLSGGQQQRLCIARALAVKPEILLMDEPTSALDPISTAKIEELALELKEHYSIVIVTHNMQQAKRISDTTAFFLLGKLIECENTEKLFSDPADSRTFDYITGRFG